MRYTTSHPRDFTRDIVEAMDAVPALCDHVHLPVQSGSNDVLKKMMRLYTREDYLERVSWIKAAKRHISLTTDVIVGFPGETPQDFEQTISLLDEVRYDSIFAFKYSPRPNTPSLQYPDTIADEEKVSRLAVLQQRQRQIQAEDYRRHLGEVLEVMAEGHNAARGQWIGRTSQNKVLNFTAAGDIQTGAYYRVRVTTVFPNSLVGEVAEPEAVYQPLQRRVPQAHSVEGQSVGPQVPALRIIGG